MLSPTSQWLALPGTLLRLSKLNGSLGAYEKIFRSTPFACRLGVRTNAIAKASIHVRGHDETEARRRADAVARWQMGRLRLRRCRSRSEHEGFALVDCAGEWSRGRGTPIEPNAGARGA